MTLKDEATGISVELSLNLNESFKKVVQIKRGSLQNEGTVIDIWSDTAWTDERTARVLNPKQTFRAIFLQKVG